MIPISRPQETVALGLVYAPLSAQMKPAKAKASGERDILQWYQNNADSLVSALSNGFYQNVIYAAVRADGTVLQEAFACDTWRDVIQVAIGLNISQRPKLWLVGLKKDGTLAVSRMDDSLYISKEQINVQSWQGIKAIACGDHHTIGLQKDGRVVGAGKNKDGQCDVADWTDIAAIACGRRHTVGLRRDGTVVAVGSNEYGQCNVAAWRDIIAIVCGDEHTIAIDKQGQVFCNSWTTNKGMLFDKHTPSSTGRVLPQRLFTLSAASQAASESPDD